MAHCIAVMCSLALRPVDFKLTVFATKHRYHHDDQDASDADSESDVCMMFILHCAVTTHAIVPPRRRVQEVAVRFPESPWQPS
jgi:hypothetical protein